MNNQKLHICAFGLLLLNTAYLWPLAEPTLFYVSNLLAHMGLGVFLTIVAVRYLLRQRAVLSGWAQCGLLLFLSSAMAGFVIMKLGGLRPYRWILHMHIALGILAVLVMGWALKAQLEKHSSETVRFAWRGYAMTLPVVLIFPLGVK